MLPEVNWLSIIISTCISIVFLCINAVIAFFLAALFGSIAGVNRDIEFRKQQDAENEKATIDALYVELKHNKANCKNNALMNETNYEIGSFVNLSDVVVKRVVFDERHKLPKVANLMKNIEYYYQAINHINKEIELHDRLIISPNSYEAIRTKRKELQRVIASECSEEGKVSLSKGSEINLLKHIDELIEKIEKIKSPNQNLGQTAKEKGKEYNSPAVSTPRMN